MAESFGLAKPEGALVAKVEKDSPADKGGLQEGDVIFKFDGKSVAQSADLSRIVGNTKPGTISTLEVWRHGKATPLKLTVGEMPDEENAKLANRSKRRGKQAEAAPANRLGLVVSDLTTDQKRQVEVDNGVLVEDVRNGLRGDVQPGDIIIALNYKGIQSEVKSVDQFGELLIKIDKNTSLTLLIKRGDAQVFVTIKAPGDK